MPEERICLITGGTDRVSYKSCANRVHLLSDGTHGMIPSNDHPSNINCVNKRGITHVSTHHHGEWTSVETECSVNVGNGTEWSIVLSMTLSEVARKIVLISLLANFVLFSETYLGYTGLNSIVVYFSFTTVLWLSCGIICICVRPLLTTLCGVVLGFLFLIFGLALLVVMITVGNFDTVSTTPWSLLALYFICKGEGLLATFHHEHGKLQSGLISFSASNPKMNNCAFWLSRVTCVAVVAIITYVIQMTSYVGGFVMVLTIAVFGLLAFVFSCSKYRSNRINHGSAVRMLIKVCREAHIVHKTYLFTSQRFGSSETVQPEHWVDFALIKNGGTFDSLDVIDVKRFLKMVRLLPALLPYWIIHAQGFSTFIYQGLHLDLNVGGFQIHPAWMILLSMVIASSIIVLYDAGVQPYLERRGMRCPAASKIIFGMVTGSLAVILAGCVETAAKSKAKLLGTFQQTITNQTFQAVHLSVFYQLPQYILLCTSEVFVFLTMLMLAFKLCPNRFRHLFLSLQYFSMAFGNVLGLILLILGWFPDDYFANNVMDVYYFLLGGGLAVGSLIFIATLPSHSQGDGNSVSRTANSPVLS